MQGQAQAHHWPDILGGPARPSPAVLTRLRLTAGWPTAVRLHLLWGERRRLPAPLSPRRRPCPLRPASLRYNLTAWVCVFVTATMLQ